MVQGSGCVELQQAVGKSLPRMTNSTRQSFQGSADNKASFLVRLKILCGSL